MTYAILILVTVSSPYSRTLIVTVSDVKKALKALCRSKCRRGWVTGQSALTSALPSQLAAEAGRVDLTSAPESAPWRRTASLNCLD